LVFPLTSFSKVPAIYRACISSMDIELRLPCAGHQHFRCPPLGWNKRIFGTRLLKYFINCPGMSVGARRLDGAHRMRNFVSVAFLPVAIRRSSVLQVGIRGTQILLTISDQCCILIVYLPAVHATSPATRSLKISCGFVGDLARFATLCVVFPHTGRNPFVCHTWKPVIP
jgi:hypothetical protein